VGPVFTVERVYGQAPPCSRSPRSQTEAQERDGFSRGMSDIGTCEPFKPTMSTRACWKSNFRMAANGCLTRRCQASLTFPPTPCLVGLQVSSLCFWGTYLTSTLFLIPSRYVRSFSFLLTILTETKSGSPAWVSTSGPPRTQMPLPLKR
jgi:hypothetical protein